MCRVTNPIISNFVVFVWIELQLAFLRKNKENRLKTFKIRNNFEAL